MLDLRIKVQQLIGMDMHLKERLRLIFLQNIELQQEAAESLKVIAASYLVVKEGGGPAPSRDPVTDN